MKNIFNSRNILSITGITGLVVGLIGLALFILGIKLIFLGGSWYYAIAGLGLILSGLLLLAQKLEGVCLYGAVFAGTIVWAVFEVGLDGWKLMPRIFTPALLGIWLCLPFFTKRLTSLYRPANYESYRRHKLKLSWAGVLFSFIVAVLVIALGYRTANLNYKKLETVAEPGPVAGSNPPVADGNWLYYGRTADGDRFSPLKEITPENAGKLQIAWKIRTGDMPYPQDTKKGREFSFENTPTKVGNNIYICTPHHKVLSINATTGKKNWEFDPHANTDANIFLACRGVAYYESPAGAAECQRRIITTTGEAKMVALDADTGKPCENFGKHGYVSLTDHMGEVPPGFHFITSQPLVIGDRMILGGWIYDNQTTGEPSGVVRAYDPATGSLAWAWDLGKANPTAPLAPGETYTRGTPNAWGTLTADPALGMVYLPLGNATPDYFGGKRRPFDDEYSSSVVALDIETGKERWHFQTVHHDLWDFDLPIGPSLVDLNTQQGLVPALVQTTKRGEFFLLDRRTGKSLTDIVEKPVPQDAAPGEYLSKTQPYPKGFPSLAPMDVKETDTWGATPIDQLLCRIDFHERHYEGQFTPPSLGKYLAYPAFFGVIDWYGASIDPSRKLLIANSSYMPMVMDYMTQEDALKKGVVTPWKGWGKEPYPKLTSVGNNPQYGTPYALAIKPWLNKLEVPCIAPPWGKLAAIDLNTHKIAWERFLGTTKGSGILGMHFAPPLPTGIASMGGNIITASGLIFIGATADDDFRAFDEKTGKLLWQAHLPAGGNATPITYMGSDGHQYVAIAAGGHGGLGTIKGDYIVAYKLP